MKHCKKCDTTKPLDEFHANKSKRDGKQPYCKPCWSAYMKAQVAKHADRVATSGARWRAKNRERRAAKNAEWRAANADRIRARNAAYREAHREELRAKGREYNARTSERQKAKYRENPGPAKERARKWQMANAERVRDKNRAWREANPERYRENVRLGQARRRARKAALPNYDILDRDVRRLLASQCAVTGCTNTDIQLDHVIPIARGGSHGIGNLQPLCSSHNQSKGARLWIEFRAYLALKERIAA